MTTLFQFNSKRKVLLFSESKQNSLLLRQQSQLHESHAGLVERDIEVETYILGKKNRAEFKKYGALGHPFLFVLIGKDGGEKLRSEQPVDSRKLFGLIDQMPMRQQEMRRKP